MRNRRRALGALTALLMAAPAAQAAPAVPDRPSPRPGSGPAAWGERPDGPRLPMLWTDDLTIDRTGDVTPDGSVSLYGSYRCVPGESENVRASVLITLAQGQERHGLGGHNAVCDGQRHRWVIDGADVGRYGPGPADAEGTLLKFDDGDSVVPLPRTTVGVEREVRLVASRGTSSVPTAVDG
ncbi:hypothetical protein HUF15_22560 [Streptomyces samsunensis]|uniref:DUF6299 domain-containing protein n=2 Tax=Streptomyces TaxID=1883 RepID=A0ABM6HCE5_9ACTN|nr:MULTISPECIES: DUF6299 family protein [Streptomyces]AQA11643.1 hypothetical protein BV401_15330 [Streptomyces autolyticus]MCM3808794.1 DUF6299 family protein [Streptomyces sp. DR7-3]NUH39513.1 hypothetical protein [Streptomyces samsunensis]